MPSFFSVVATTLQLQAPFTALMALVVFRLYRIYGSRPMRDLAIGWSLWTARLVVAGYAAGLRAMGESADAPIRRLSTAIGVALVLAAIPYLVSGTLALARGQEEHRSPHRLSAGLVAIGVPMALLVTAPGVPSSWRLTLLILSSTISFSVAFCYVAWQLWRHAADDLTAARQIAAVAFGTYALKQLWNAQAIVTARPPETSGSAVAENIVLIMVAMGSLALLFDRQRQRELQAEREQRRLQAELVAREHLESLGRLAGGIAHDFNNLLTSVRLGVQLARDVADDRTALLEELEAIESTSLRATALTRQLLTFARREQVSPETFDIVARVQGLHRYLERQLTGHVRLETEAGEASLYVTADPGQFDQAIINLLLNARDAVPESSGTIRVVIARERATLPGGDVVRVTVEDNGIGMDAATQARIFEPFFTTKGQDKGTGLGLSIVHGAVTRANGTITVHSTQGAGTRFDIRLPLDVSHDVVNDVSSDVRERNEGGAATEAAPSLASLSQ